MSRGARPGREARLSAKRRWQESPVTGKSTKDTVKTIAQGRPDVSAYTCGPTPVHSYRTGGHGCGGHPVFPAPSVFGGTDIRKTSGASSRENAACCLGVLSYQLFDNLPPAPPVRNLMDRVRCPNRDNRA